MVLLCAKLRCVEYQCGCALYQQKWNEHEGTKTYSILKLDLTCSCPGCAQWQSWTSVSNTNCQHVWHHRATIFLDLDHLDHLGLLCNWIHWGPFHCTMLHSCCTAILSTYRLSTFSISAVDSGVLSQVARSKPKTLFRVGMRPFLRSAAFASSDLVRFLSDFYGFLGGPVAWSELDAQRRLSGAEDSFVLFVDIEWL